MSTEKKRKYKKKSLLLLLLAVIGIPAVIASVFVFYPMNVNITQVSPPVIFLPGSNANKEDIGGNTITVNIGPNSTSATLTLHPTYQRTYYEDVLEINNTDSNSYYLTIRVDNPMTLPSGGTATLILYNGTTKYLIDLTNTGDTQIGLEKSGEVWKADVVITIPEGGSLVSTSASISLVYSPSNGSPP